MNLKRFASSALLAAAMHLGTASADAQSVAVNYEPGDLLMGFRAEAGDGASKCYVVNLGPAANYTGAASPFTVANLGNIKADLDATFTEINAVKWSNQSSVFWSVSGVNSNAPSGTFAGEPTRTLFATKVQAVPGTPNTTRLLRNLSGTQAAPSNKMVDFEKSYEFVSGDDINGSKNLSTANSDKAVLQNVSDINSYASYQPGGTATNSGSGPFNYGAFAPSIEANFANGTANSILELYRLKPGTAGTPGDFIGTFRLDDNANVTFTPALPAGVSTLNLSAATYSVSEADAGGKLTVQINRSGDTSGSVSVTIGTTNGTAQLGTDFSAPVPTTVSFAAAETQKTVDIPITVRNGFQGNRTFTVTLSSPSGGGQLGSTVSATVTILESEAAVALSSATYSFAENVGNGAITLVRTGNVNSAFTVDFSTTAGTALADTDFTAQTNAQVSFAAGDAQKTVNVAILNRTGSQSSRDFTVALSNASTGATIVAPTTATVTITDAGMPGTLAFSSSTYLFTPKDANGAVSIPSVVISRTGGVDGTVTADLSIAAGGTLTSPGDFTFSSPTTVTFNQGEASKTLELPLVVAKAGTINLSLGNATGGATIGAQNTATITVSAIDVAVPKVGVDGFPKPIPANFNLTGFATDNAGISRVEVKVNGGATQLATVGAFTAGKATYSLAFAPENGTNTITFQAVDLQGNKSAVVTKTLTYANLRPALAGAYNGLLVPAVTPSNANSGFVTFKVTSVGVFTGKATLGGFVVPISGIIGNDGKAHFKPTFATTFALVGKKPLTQLGSLAFTVAGTQAIGTLKDANNVTVANLTADRAFFDGKTNIVPVDYLANKGFYTVVFPSKAQIPTVASNLYPQGDGIGSITVTAKGSVTLKGTLADGSKISASVPLSQTLAAPIFAQLYGKLGSIAGMITLDKNQTDSDLKGTDFLWFNPANVAAKYYPAGWATGIKVDLLGAKYFAGTGTPVLAGLNAVDPNGNATLDFADGKLTSNPLNKGLNIDPATNKVANLLVAGVLDKSFSLKLVAAKGSGSGTFLHTDNTKTKFGLAIFQKGPGAGGYGYFLSTVPKGMTNGESGGVSLTKK